jgi:hypothetical protein
VSRGQRRDAGGRQVIEEILRIGENPRRGAAW